MCGGKPVITFCKVPVERSDDGILPVRVINMSRPWPMQGPQAFAKTTPPTLSKSLMKPSLSMVKRTSSEPGVMVNSLFVFKPLLTASLTMEAERLMSS
jgi:hypothetical protein